MNLINILTEEASGFAGWCNEEGVRQAFALIKNILDILRIVVPIGLILMTSIDIAKKVINPEEKDGQKKIMTRLFAAIIVFLIPTIISIFLRIVDAGKNAGNSGKSSNIKEEAKSGLSCFDGWY